MNRIIELSGESPDSYSQNGSAFIQFNSQKAAHIACQAVTATMPRQMTERAVEISPADINWSNLNLTWTMRSLRRVGKANRDFKTLCYESLRRCNANTPPGFLLLFALLIFVFGVISLFTGILSKISTLAGSTSWLHWIGNLPTWLLSFIQGTLPPVIQVLLLSGPLPILLRAMTNRTRGAITGSEGERSLQFWYFIFLVFELFIIPTISSGLTSIVEELIQSPTSVPNILATNLPTAANYYFSFLIVQALSISASSIAQTIRQLNYVFGRTNTPDSVFTKLSFTWRTRIGSNIPWYSTFAIIGLVYSVIAPLILVFMIITFSLFWVVVKNNVLYVVRTGNVDSGGLFFPSAINQTFTGLYFMEFCLIGLFFLVRDVEQKVACEAQGIIMAFVLISTICYQIWLTANFNALLKYAPIQLEMNQEQRQEYDSAQPLTGPDEKSDTHSQKSQEDTKEVMVDKNPIDSAATKLEDDPQPDLERPTFPQLPSNHSLRALEIQARQKKDSQSAKHILARVNRPLDETRLAQLEDRLQQRTSNAGSSYATRGLVPNMTNIEAKMMSDPISHIIMQHNDELEDLSVEERDMLVSVAFTHPVLLNGTPSVWIPSDDIGVSDNEVKRTREFSQDVAIDNRGAYFNSKFKVIVNRAPPDMSEFALIIAEL